MMNDAAIEIIIPSWNGQELLQKNLPSVITAWHAIPTQKKQITVIDDGSTDGSIPYIKLHFPVVHTIRNEKNIGFHRTINKAVAASTADIVLLLNNDIEPAPDAFSALYTPFLEEENLFAVSGKIYSEDKKRFLYGNRGGMFRYGHFRLREKDPHALSQTLFACGGAGAFCRRTFLALGAFDTLFSPFYYEEIDISYRALKRGYRILYAPHSIMYHTVQATVRKKLSRWQVRLLSARNNYLFIIKNITDLSWTLAFLSWTPLGILHACLCANPRFLIAFLMAVPRIPRAIHGRLHERKKIVRTDAEIFRAVNR